VDATPAWNPHAQSETDPLPQIQLDFSYPISYITLVTSRKGKAMALCPPGLSTTHPIFFLQFFSNVAFLLQILTVSFSFTYTLFSLSCRIHSPNAFVFNVFRTLTKTPGVYPSIQSRSLLVSSSRPAKPFKINTYKIALCKSFRMNTYEKRGRGASARRSLCSAFPRMPASAP
jgi:hypothetical protein